MTGDTCCQTEKAVCFVCNEAAVRRRIYCSDCKVWAHISCANKKKCCDKCNDPTTPGMSSSCSSVSESLDEGTLKNLITTINGLSSAMADMKKAMKDLIDENKKLRLELENLKKTRQSNVVDPNTNENFEEIVIEEAMERIRRESNVIIRGIPEPLGIPINRNNQIKSL